MQGLLLVIRIVALVAALLAITGAATAATATDPKALALRQADFPANARLAFEQARRSAPLPGGGHGPAYAATFRIPRGEKREDVHILVVTPGSVAKARGVFARAVADAKDFVDIVQHSNPRLPAYGNAQYVAVTGDPGAEETGGRIWVRKGAVVWGIEVSTDPLAHDFGLSRATTLAELRTYARKERQRAGDGR
jgi:hypothetical protein